MTRKGRENNVDNGNGQQTETIQLECKVAAEQPLAVDILTFSPGQPVTNLFE